MDTISNMEKTLMTVTYRAKVIKVGVNHIEIKVPSWRIETVKDLVKRSGIAGTKYDTSYLGIF